MTGARLDISLSDLPLREGLDGLLAAATNLRPMMVIATGIFENSTRTRFDQERGPGGIPWPKSWRAKEQGGKTLQDKGNLRGSLTSNVGDNFAETGFDGRSESSRHAASHQFGVTIRPRTAKALAFTGPDGKFHMAQSVTIPRREMLGVDNEDLRDLLEAFVDYLESATDGI